MKAITFESEAKRLNIPIKSTKQIFEKALKMGKLCGVIEPQNELIICYEPAEIELLIKSINSGEDQISELANEFKLSPEQMELIIRNLLSSNKLDGVLSTNGKFISTASLLQLVINLSTGIEKIDVADLSARLFVSESPIQKSLDILIEQVNDATKLFSKIRIEELSDEIRLSPTFTLALLKWMITEGKMKGQIDMVNHALVLKQTPLAPEGKIQEDSVSYHSERIQEQESGIMNTLTKHADWQPLPQSVSRNLPICPLCKQRTNWAVHDRYGLTTRGYQITCNTCGAEWEYISSKPKDIVFGGAIAALYRVSKFTDDDSIWILKKSGNSKNVAQFLEREISFSKWKQMAGVY